MNDEQYFTQDELGYLKHCIECVLSEWSHDNEEYERGLIKKISELIYKNELAEHLDDKCKSGRHVGEELRKRLLNGKVVLGGPTEAVESDDSLIDAFKKVEEALKYLSEEDTTKLFNSEEYFRIQGETSTEWVQAYNKGVAEARIKAARDDNK